MHYDKFIIVVAKDSHNVSLAFVVINSEANPNVAYSAYLKSLHIEILKAESPFLDRNSYVDCSKLREFPIQHVIDFLIKNPERAVGNVSTDVLKSIHMTLTRASTIEPIMKKKFGF